MLICCNYDFFFTLNFQNSHSEMNTKLLWSPVDIKHFSPMASFRTSDHKQQSDKLQHSSFASFWLDFFVCLGFFKVRYILSSGIYSLSF